MDRKYSWRKLRDLIAIALCLCSPLANSTELSSVNPSSKNSADLNALPAKPVILSSLGEIQYRHISSDYGNRIGPFTGLHENHDGLDIPAELGSPILSAGKGVVLYAAYAPGYGNLVEIDHGQGIITRYGHAKQLLVKAGEVVEQSQQIATVGSTGKSTGPHLHFEVSKQGVSVDPKLLLAIEGNQSQRNLKQYTFVFKDLKLKAPSQLKSSIYARNNSEIVYASSAKRKSGESIVMVKAPAGKALQ